MKKDNHYFAWGLTAVAVVCAVMLIYDLVFRDSIVLAYTKKMISILAPILYGFAMAYLLAPIVNWFERAIFRRGGSKATPTALRFASILLTWVVVFALLYGLMSILLPELVSSIKQLAANAKGYYDTIEAWSVRLLNNNPELARQAQELFNQYYQDALLWINRNVVPQLQAAVLAVTGGVLGVLTFFKNLFIGVMVSLYLLGAKENFSAISCRLCYTLLSEDRASWFIRGVKATDRIFSGFVRGKLLDSLIIGVICLVCCNLLQFPYPALISVIIGVTNIIPFFGPFIGAIPCGLLIFLVNPLQAVYFAIFILVLQQFDGNILGPKILGDSTGLASFWVLFSILLFGGLFGFAGMVLGVPVFAMLYSILSRLVARGLRQRGLPVETAQYMGKTEAFSACMPEKKE